MAIKSLVNDDCLGKDKSTTYPYVAKSKVGIPGLIVLFVSESCGFVVSLPRDNYKYEVNEYRIDWVDSVFEAIDATIKFSKD